MFDIITIGSATRDVFARSTQMHVRKSAASKTGRDLCVPLGSKIELDELHFRTGGSAVNAAMTFARQGFHVATIAKVGDDQGGRAIMERAHERGISFLMHPQKGAHTAYSILLDPPGGERTILIRRGIAEHILHKDIPWGKLAQAKWWYVTHLGGPSGKLFAPLMRFAAEHDISVAFNPGRTQLALQKKLIPLLKPVRIFVLNREEASYLTGVPYGDREKIFTVLDKWVAGLVVMTEGPQGVRVSDGTYRWSAGTLKESQMIDRTGAGDAFGSGFVSAIIKGKSVEDAIQLASANATGVLGMWGANKGLLGKRDSPYKYGKLKITKITIGA